RHRRRHIPPAERIAGICANDRVSPLLAVSERLFVPLRWGWSTPKQSRSCSGFRQAQFLLRDSVLLQGGAIGGIDRTLGGQKAGGRAASDPPCADKFGNHSIATAHSAAPPLIRASHPLAIAPGCRKSGDHVSTRAGSRTWRCKWRNSAQPRRSDTVSRSNDS